MRIAQIANVIERVPPKKYGGTERVVQALTEGLVKRGHEVTLFATGDSITTANLVSVVPKALRESNKIRHLYSSNPLTLLNIGLAYKRQKEFDIIHDHTFPISLPTANISKTPVVLTMHSAINSETKKMLTRLNNPFVVTISNAQLSTNRNGLNYAGTVYNGLNMKNYPFSPSHGGYLLYVGRISEEKGVHFAIKAAKKLNLSLVIAAKLDQAMPHDMEYFYSFIKPELDDKIIWVGEVDEKTRNKLMSRALCFLHPVTWPEPFGLTLIEAMACGCPVVAFDNGSIPEVLSQGVTGFVVRNFTQMLKAILKIDNISRFACRSYSLKNFNADRMVDGYEEVYRRILQRKVNVISSQTLNTPLTA